MLVVRWINIIIFFFSILLYNLGKYNTCLFCNLGAKLRKKNQIHKYFVIFFANFNIFL